MNEVLSYGSPPSPPETTGQHPLPLTLLGFKNTKETQTHFNIPSMTTFPFTVFGCHLQSLDLPRNTFQFEVREPATGSGPGLVTDYPGGECAELRHCPQLQAEREPMHWRQASSTQNWHATYPPASIPQRALSGKRNYSLKQK